MTLYSWQKRQWNQLTQAYQQHRFPHAILLYGQPGLGKFDFALQFSNYILCQNRSADPAPCHQCKSCHLFLANSHPDMNVLTRDEESSVIRLEQIRGVLEQANQTSHSGGYQITVVYPAEKMNISAANALLKTLEEPPGRQSLFILVTDQLQFLPATIRSRCQSIKFSTPEREESQRWFKNSGIEAGDDEFDFAFDYAHGAPLMMGNLLENGKLAEIRKLYQLLTSILQTKKLCLSEVTKQAMKLHIHDFFSCLQFLLIRCIIDREKIRPEKLYSLLDTVQFQKHTLAKGIALNHQLSVESCLIQLSLLKEGEAENAD